MDPLFAPLPEGYAELSREELQNLIDERLAIVDKVLENKNDPEEHTEFIGERSGTEVMEELTSGVEDIEKLKDALKAKTAEEANYASAVEELAAKAREGLEAEASEEQTVEGDGVEKEGIEVPADGTEAELAAAEAKEDEPAEPAPDDPADDEKVDEKEEAIVASAVSRPAPPRVSRERKPLPAAEPANGAAPLRASAGFADLPPGKVLERDELVEALISAHELSDARDGARVKTIVASARVSFPPERLLGRDANINWDLIQQITSPQAILASGGFCAPYQPLYDLPFISSKARPVKAALANFGVPRGGITYPTPLSVADVSDGVGIVTNEDDELGGTFGAKSCVVIDCEPFQSADVDAIYACVTHGNLNARAWPERVANVGDLLDVQHAIVAETNLLDQISAGSTALTDDQKYGAVSTLLEGVIKAATAYRSRHRMDPNARLRVMLPANVIGLLQADMIHGQFDRFHAQSEIERLFGLANVNVSFYMDTPTGAGQVYGAQGAGTLDNFLTTVVWYLFHEGAWLFLDFGRLDLGVVRDSSLNLQNDFQVFMETFEGAAFVGIESLEITSTVCADGTYAPTASAEC